MNNFFNYNNITGEIELNTPEILLINEFAALMDKNRNKCKEDPKGEHKLRAFKEFKYIYLCLFWNSPYCDYDEQERHIEALKDSGLTEEEFNNPEFRAACRKFKELQNSNRSIRLLGAARDTVSKFIDYFHNIDVEERDAQTGKPIFSVKNVIAELTSLNKVHEALLDLEARVKKEIAETSSIRANAVDGYLPNF